MKNLLLVMMVFGVLVQAVSAEPSDTTAEARVRELYDMISIEPGGSAPDWNHVRTFFLDEAVIYMRTSREASSTFTLDEWVGDFQKFIVDAKVLERGFDETIVRVHATEFRNIAEVMVLYEASFRDSTRPPQQGVDMIHLGRVDGQWRIVSIVNEIPEEPEQIPGLLKP